MRRRHRAAAPILVLLTLALIGVLYAAVGSAATAQASNEGATTNAQLVKQGQQLFAEGCSSCHGLGAQGGPEAPTLIGVGSAAVDFQISPESDPMALELHPELGRISVYAQRKDYHDVVKGALKRLAQWFVHQTGDEVKGFVDTAPVLEKTLAEAAGLGWQGKHSNLVSREHGSWLLLGAIYTTAELGPDAPGHDHCGSCNACQTTGGRVDLA